MNNSPPPPPQSRLPFSVSHLIYAVAGLPRRQLFLAAAVVATGSAVFMLTLSRYTTENREFCLSCHEYQRPDFERKSQVHPTSVVCVECHAEHGRLAAGRHWFFSADRAELKVNCLRCHADVVDREPTFKFNEMNIRVDHKLHLREVGASCVDCHYTVAHDRREEPTNRPMMQACFKCHQLGSRRCVLCHDESRLPAPPISSSIDERTCERCHGGDYEKQSIPLYGMMFSHSKHLSNLVKCESCHDNNPKHGQLTQTKESCLGGCHRQNKPASHFAEWKRYHGAAFRGGAVNCRQCHSGDTCQRCHKIGMPHSENWLSTHPAAAGTQGATCQKCHTLDTCRQCHATVRPASHKWNWRHAHGRASKRTCSACHEDQFCRACHTGLRPESHGPGWVSAHGSRAKSDRAGCAKCHTPGFCTACHGIEMPHPSGWSSRLHPQTARKNREACSRCHLQSFCSDCHVRHKPASHTTEWRKMHGQTAERKGGEACATCHGKDSSIACIKCHGIEMPHPASWRKDHAKQVKQEEEVCQRCHGKTPCMNCHQTEMPHPKGWATKLHPPLALQKPEACLRCHTDPKDCTKCHDEDNTPRSHESDTYGKDHGKLSKGQENLCTLCHGAKGCETCHKAKGVTATTRSTAGK